MIWNVFRVRKAKTLSAGIREKKRKKKKACVPKGRLRGAVFSLPRSRKFINKTTGSHHRGWEAIDSAQWYQRTERKQWWKVKEVNKEGRKEGENRCIGKRVDTTKRKMSKVRWNADTRHYVNTRDPCPIRNRYVFTARSARLCLSLDRED